MALPGVVVHRVEGQATGLYGPRPGGGHTMCLRTSNMPVSTGSFRPGLLGVRFGQMPLNHVIREFKLMFSSSMRYTSLFTTTGCSGGGCRIMPSAMSTLPGCGVFSQVSAMAQCTLPSPVLGSSGSTGNVRPYDVEKESPRKTRHIHGRSARLEFGMFLFVVQDQDVQELARAVVYDCRPSVLPVSIKLSDLRRSSVVRPAASSSLAAPPAEETPGPRGSVPEGVAAPGFAAVSSDDPGTDLEDKLLHVSLLPTIISPLPDSDTALPVYPSRYLEPPVPALADSVTTSQLSPVPIRVGNTFPTRDLFPSYTISPECSFYAPATSPIRTDMPDTSEYLSPGSPAAMDRILAGDGDLLLDYSSDLPMMLLPLPTSSVLPPEPVVAPSAATSPDLSREGPFDAGQRASVSGAVPLVLDSSPGCQYRMTSYDNADVTNVDPAYGLQLHHPRFLEYVGVPESAHLLNPEDAVSAALQLQHGAGLMMTNLQVGQFVTSLNRMSSEVMRLAFGQEQYPSAAIQDVSPSPLVRRAAHYMTAMASDGWPRCSRASADLVL